MKRIPSVTIIGGGIAGISAAVFLAEKGFKVHLLEASGKLGGRAYTYFDKILDDTADNGQHILAGWYKYTFEFLGIIGSMGKLEFQKQLKVKFIKQDSNSIEFKCPFLFPPLNFVFGIIMYNALSIKDKLSIFKLITVLISNKFSYHLDNLNTEEFLKLSNQTEGLVHYFWNPFITSVFNAKPKETSAKLFVNIIKTGLYKNNNLKLVFPKVTLNELYIEPAVEYLKTKSAKVKYFTKPENIKISDNKIDYITLNDGFKLQSDYFISAVPYWELETFMGDYLNNNLKYSINELKSSAIINVYFKFYENIDKIIKDIFLGTFDTTIQWIFRVKKDQVCLVISSANEIAKYDKDEIIQLAKRELFHCFPALINTKIKSVRVIKEMRATFIPDINSLTIRPRQKTKLNNFFIAGDWTDTGLPASLESAVKSSKICVNELLKLESN